MGLTYRAGGYYPISYTGPYGVGYPGPVPQVIPTPQPVVPSVPTQARQNDTTDDSGSDSDSSSNSNLPEEHDNDPNYPNGNAEREVRAGTIEARTNSWKATQWVWRSCGFVKAEVSDGTVRKVELRKCRGVLRCPNCHRLTRPGTDTRKRDKQRLSPCYRCRVFPIEVPCDVKSLHFPILRDGIQYLRWEQQGRHTHSRPPLSGHLTQEQMVEIDKQVLRRPDATPHQHRVGDRNPGSVPLHEISPALTDPRRAQYQVARSKERLGIGSSMQKGGLSLLHTVGQLNQKFGEDFMVESQLHPPTYISYQTKFMRDRVQDYVDSWLKEDENGPSISRHGIVTDGDNSSFAIGVLLVSCAFDATLEQWVPLLYTWIAGQDTLHH
ncbi:hypothetical protein H0H93_012691, partial [Arthromyces matolae]